MTEQRLIDANAEIAAIKENVCKNCNSYGGVRCRSCWVDDAIGFLEDAPTVDAVEVVRCFECQKEGTEDCPMVSRDCLTGCLCANTKGNDFCSHGERRTAP